MIAVYGISTNSDDYADLGVVWRHNQRHGGEIRKYISASCARMKIIQSIRKMVKYLIAEVDFTIKFTFRLSSDPEELVRCMFTGSRVGLLAG